MDVSDGDDTLIVMRFWGGVDELLNGSWWDDVRMGK